MFEGEGYPQVPQNLATINLNDTTVLAPKSTSLFVFMWWWHDVYF